jgi:hypothetical protein
MSRKLISNDLLLKIFLLGTISTKISKTKNLKGYFYAAVHDQLFYLQWCSDQAGAPSLRNYVSSSEKGLPCSVLFPLTSVATYICEKGLWNAPRQLFPGIPIKGCVFHWCQAMFRKIQKSGLAVSQGIIAAPSTS